MRAVTRLAAKGGVPLNLGEARQAIGGFPIRFADGGRAEHGVSAQTRDCGVRAIAIVTGRPYGDVEAQVEQYLAAEMIEDEAVDRALSVNTLLAILGHREWTYCDDDGRSFQLGGGLPEGKTLIVHIDDHFCAMVDGEIRDTRDHTGSDVPVEGYFIAKRSI